MKSDVQWITGVDVAVGAVLLISLIGFFIFRAFNQVPQADEVIVMVGKN